MSHQRVNPTEVVNLLEEEDVEEVQREAEIEDEVDLLRLLGEDLILMRQSFNLGVEVERMLGHKVQLRIEHRRQRQKMR